MKTRTQDKAARAAAAQAETLASSATSAGDPVPDSRTGEPDPDPYDVAREIVLRQLDMVPRSRAQLEQKLSQRGCPADVTGAVLDRLTEAGLIDDQAFAQMLVRSQQTGRGLARRALARELRTKGISDGLAHEALASISDADERDRARVLVDKKLRVMHGPGRRGPDPPAGRHAGAQGLCHERGLRRYP
jgi:regulatory protein